MIIKTDSLLIVFSQLNAYFDINNSN